MFHKSAAYYDLIYRELKDYPDEALKLDYLLSQFDPKPKHILDIGCGTGEHAYFLAKHFGYQVDGIDLEPALIEIAAAKNPEGEFSVADMRHFSLPRRYDALLCLFSSIGYVETEEGLDQAVAAMGRHLKPGGWLICEPWLAPEDWQDGQIDVVETEDEATGNRITRTRVGRTEEGVSVLDIEYDVETGDGAEPLRFNETHRLGLFTRERISTALKRHGFEARWAEQGLHGSPFAIATYTTCKKI